MHPGRTLASAIYAVLLLLAMLPLVEVILTAWPLQPSALPWRVGFVGLLSRALPIPLLVTALALVAAFVLRHLRMLRWLSIFCFGVAALLVPFGVILALDALQMRGVVRPEVMLIYDVTAIRGMATLIAMSGIFLWLGAGGWSAVRKLRAQPSPMSDRVRSTDAASGGISGIRRSSSAEPGERPHKLLK